MSFFRPNLMSLAVALGCLAGAPSAHAIDLLSGFGADGVYGEQAMAPNDDGSSSLLNLPFAINFFGNTYDHFYVNNNGNITFESALSTYTPRAFPIANQPTIAPWWGDVDTRGAHLNASGSYLGTNNVYVGSPNADTVVITWDKVGYFNTQTNKINDFQLVIRNRADTGAGNFDFDFRYKQLEWTTGSASGGSNGLGGTPAQAGYDDGRQTNYLTLPGSRTADVLDLVNTSNVDVTTPGLWTFAVRNGQTPGFSPSNPLLPVFVDGAFVFDFNVVLNQRVWIDPDVAVGYTYDLASADLLQDFDSIQIDTVAGDGLYDVFTWDGTQWVLVADDLAAGTVFTFVDGVRRVMVNGIELGAALDPANPQAFVTGFTFGRAGNVQVTQTPTTVTVAVPEPETYALVLAGLAVAWGARRRQNKAA
jgi:hypothetical protein